MDSLQYNHILKIPDINVTIVGTAFGGASATANSLTATAARFTSVSGDNITASAFIFSSAAGSGSITASAFYGDGTQLTLPATVSAFTSVTATNITATSYSGLPAVVSAFSSVTGLSVVATTIVATGNITASAFCGDGSLLTGISASVSAYTSVTATNLTASSLNLQSTGTFASDLRVTGQILYKAIACKVEKSVAQNVTAFAWTPVIWGSASYDTNSFWNSATTTSLTIPQGLDGIYMVVSYLAYGDNPSSQNRGVAITKNGTQIQTYWFPQVDTTGRVRKNIAGAHLFASGDKVGISLIDQAGIVCSAAFEGISHMSITYLGKI